MTNPVRTLELLSPARDAATAREAILHGADAVYIGASGFGARESAANPVADIAELVEFAHRFRAKVYVTLNTVVFDDEVAEVEELARQLYRAGVDALIVQDMGLLRMDIPPIELHASTQCDNRTPEKARFLQDVGFSQVVLARELTLPEIREVARSVDVPVECFVHGALCVSYSGRCQASLASGGRSANRGRCAQMCRLPWTLTDAKGRVLAADKYLLSLKDFNASASLKSLVEAGAGSFKIEGRLKDAAYVKNITALYRRQLDSIISESAGEYRRSSVGDSDVTFRPLAEKSFNRGFSDYFLTSRRPLSLASLRTPKSLGDPISDISQLNPGDGISYFDTDGKYVGTRVNRVENGKIMTFPPKEIPKGTTIYRTFDLRRSRQLERPTAVRTIKVDMVLDEKGLTLDDERGMHVRVAFSPTLSDSRKPADRRAAFAKTGNTIYRLGNFIDLVGPDKFIPVSELAAIRREGLAALDEAAEATYCYSYRREELPVAYPSTTLDYRDNVTNRLARDFYADHGVRSIETGADCAPSALEGRKVMTCRHCVLRELGKCLRTPQGRDIRLPLTIVSDRHRFQLDFDCDTCEMSVVKPAASKHLK